MKQNSFKLAMCQLDQGVVDGAGRKAIIRCENADLLYDALKSCIELFDKVLPHFNWGASAINAEDVQLLNSVPSKAKRALDYADKGREFKNYEDAG